MAMVTNVTSMGRSGVSDWLLQRASAVILLAYTVFIVGYILLTPELDYSQWRALFEQLWMRIFSLLALLAIVEHAWIGLWVVITEYLTERAIGSKAIVLRVLAQGEPAQGAGTDSHWGMERDSGVSV